MLTDQSIQVDYGKIDTKDQKALDKRLANKVNILNKFLTDHGDILKIRVQQHGKSLYMIELNLLNSSTLHSTGKGDNISKALENAFTPLKENLLQQLNKQKIKYDKSPRQQRSQILNQAYGKLQEHISISDKVSFNKQLIPLIKDLNLYIARRIKYAHLIGMDKDRKITTAEMVSRTIEIVYSQFQTKPKDFTLEHWLFALADQELSDAFNENLFEQQHLEDWDKYVERALADMDENISISAEGNPELTEDLDDTENINNLFPNKFSYEFDYDQNLTDKNQISKIMKELAKLPSLKRSVFELFAIEGFSVKEIAKIKNKKKEDIDAIVNDVRVFLKSSLN